MRRGALEQVSRWLATGFGTGFLWPAPGTWGSLLGVGLFVLLLAPLAWPWQLAAGVVLTLVGTLAAHVAAPGLGGDDPSAVVIDEWAAMWLSLVAVHTPLGMVLAFFLFRLFDIFKPYPGRRLEQLPGGLGIMADDVIAALYTQIVLRLLFAAGAWAGLGAFIAGAGRP